MGLVYLRRRNQGVRNRHTRRYRRRISLCLATERDQVNGGPSATAERFLQVKHRAGIWLRSVVEHMSLTKGPNRQSVLYHNLKMVELMF